MRMRSVRAGCKWIDGQEQEHMTPLLCACLFFNTLYAIVNWR